MGKWKKIQCPSCAAPLEIEEGARRARCEYCGSTCEVGATGMFQVVVAPPAAATPALQAELTRLPADVLERARRGARVIRAIVLVAFALAGLGIFVALRLAGVVGGGGAGLFEHMQWDGQRQAILEDLSGDGRPDVIGFIRLLGSGETPLHLAAFDVAKESRLWDLQVQPTTDDAQYCHVVLAGGRLWVTDGLGNLRGVEPRSGQEIIRLAAGEQVEALCGDGQGGVQVWLKDKRALRLDPGAGTLAPHGQWGHGAPCGGLWSDENSTPTTRLDGWPRVRPESFWPELEEAPGHGGPQFGGIEVERLLRDLAGPVDFGLGRRKEGTRVPAVVAVERATGRLSWKAELPQGNPLQAEDDEIQVAGLAAGRLVVPYQVKGGGDTWRLACFDAGSGARLWDVALPGSERLSAPKGIVSDGAHLYVSHWTWLRVLDLKTGALETTIGRW